MAISARAVGAWTAANATTQTRTLPTHAAGDMLLVRVTAKHATLPMNITCGTAGWTKLGQYANGTTVSANGLGSVTVAVFYKEAASAAETSPVITYHASTAATPSMAVAVSYQKGASEGWVTPVGDGGPDNTSGTTHVATIQTHVSATAGDLIDFFTGICDDSTLTVPTFTQAGLTLGTVAEYPATAGTSTTSNDISADGGYRAVSSGTSSAAAVVTNTINTAETGTSWTTRLRVQALVIEALAGTGDGVSDGSAAVTRTRGLAGTAAEASDATLASPARALSLAGTSAAVATGTGLISRAMALAGTSAAVADATGRAGLPRALAGTSAAVAATPTAPLRRARPVAGTSGAVATGTGVVVRVRRIAGTAAEASDSTSELTKVSGNIKALAGTSDAVATAEAALFRARNVALLGTAAETATASATATKYRALAASAAASGAATGVLLRHRTIAGTADALSAAEAVVDVDRWVALAALAETISSVSAVLTVELGLLGMADAASEASALLSVVPLERRRWDGTQWNPGSIYRRRFTQV